MHFGFGLDSSDIDLWNIYLLDTHLDLLDIASKHFVCFQDMSSRCLQDMSSRCLKDIYSRRLEDVFIVTIFRLPTRLQDVLEDVKFLHWRRVEDVFKTCLVDVFKTSWRPTNVCWEPMFFLLAYKMKPLWISVFLR